MLPGAYLARMVASTPGFDVSVIIGLRPSPNLADTRPQFVLVDCEHGNISDSAMHESVHAIAACGISPLVRVAAPETHLIKRALDTGAHGIMAPMCNSADEARKIVSYCKFPTPVAERNESTISGVRGVGSPFAPAVYQQSLADYIATANRNTMVIVQIETVEGLENCEEIAKVPGVGALSKDAGLASALSH